MSLRHQCMLLHRTNQPETCGYVRDVCFCIDIFISVKCVLRSSAFTVLFAQSKVFSVMRADTSSMPTSGRIVKGKTDTSKGLSLQCGLTAFIAYRTILLTISSFRCTRL